MQAFSDKNKDAKALILLTDGEDHNKETLSVIKKAKESGLRIFTIGIGTSDGATLPDEFGQGHKKDKSGRVILTKLNADLLQRIARETGGVYFRSAKGEVEADRIQKQIQLISTKGLSKDWGVEYEENYQFFLILVLVILTAEWILSESRRS